MTEIGSQIRPTEQDLLYRPQAQGDQYPTFCVVTERAEDWQSEPPDRIPRALSAPRP